MKGTLKAMERGLHSYGAPALAGAAAVSARSAWPVVAMLVVMAAQAAVPALREFLMAIARQLGPAVGEVLSAAVRRRGFRAAQPGSEFEPRSVQNPKHLSVRD